jgi:putative sterol carrier protein
VATARTTRSNAAKSKARAKATATDATSIFFNELAKRGHEPLLQRATGSIRFDLADGAGHGANEEHWHVSIVKGDVTVTRRKSRADAIMRLDHALCDQLVTGRANAMAAMLRGLIDAEGDLSLVMQIQRLFPGPPRRPGSSRRGGKTA